MSVGLDWSKLDTAIADKVRDMLNERFQTLSLPSMLKSIHILSFEFGSIPPTIEIQHITDPPSGPSKRGEEKLANERRGTRLQKRV